MPSTPISLLLPFGLVDSLGIFTPVITVFVSYPLIGLEAIGAEVSEPFGTAPNCPALNALTRSSERSLLELCDRAIPDEETPIQIYQLD
jgi:putative membrane protein